jgi:hypothetical protein
VYVLKLAGYSDLSSKQGDTQMPKFIEWDGTYTMEQLKNIEALKQVADETPFLSAVVDYLGFFDQENGWVDLKSDSALRFGVRSLAHVNVYKFRVVHYGKRAREAGYGQEG